MAIGVLVPGMGGLSGHHCVVDRFPAADFIVWPTKPPSPSAGGKGRDIAACKKMHSTPALNQGDPMRVLLDLLRAALGGLLVLGSLSFLIDLSVHVGLNPLLHNLGTDPGVLQGAAVFAVLCLPIGLVTLFGVSRPSFYNLLAGCLGAAGALWIGGGKLGHGIAGYLYEADWEGLRAHARFLPLTLFGYLVVASAALILRATPLGRGLRLVPPPRNGPAPLPEPSPPV